MLMLPRTVGEVGSRAENDVFVRKDLMIGLFCGSEVDDQAGSYESQGSNAQKHGWEDGGTATDRSAWPLNACLGSGTIASSPAQFQQIRRYAP
ncbi:hypothetical protein VNO77_19217 [Canavalia gladiata]|uniref:Uncharacterized protein n=1 Tax=Canavalia gladiata TaxID=3824 RepID=A0AAN9QPE4_CANGL